MTSSLHLGDTSLDDDHDRLQRYIAVLQAAAPEQAVHAIDDLRAHAAVHFAAEDQDLLAIKDGNSQCHIDEHSAVLKSLDDVRAVLVNDKVLTDAKASLVKRLASELRAWLPEHIREMDAAVVTYRLKQRFGGAPVRIMRREMGTP